MSRSTFFTPTTNTVLYPYHHIVVDDTWTGVHSSWRAILAEFIGTLMYVFISSGLAIATNTFVTTQPGVSHTLLVVALGNGLAFTALVFALLHISGGHLNPATTWGAIITRRIGIMRGIAYIMAQVVGAILGALLITAATPDEYHGRMGAHFWEESLTNFNGVLLEASLTFFLVFVVFATSFDPVGLGNLAPLPIGLTVVFGYLIGWVFVGPPMNPARALGTAIVYGNYDHIWVYWVGPLVGSTLAALVYTVLFLSRTIPVREDKVVYGAVPTMDSTHILAPGVSTV